MKKFAKLITSTENYLSTAFQHILFSLSILLFMTLIVITMILHHNNSDILIDLFAKNDYSKFTSTYSFPIGLTASWLAITTLFFTVRRIILTDKQLHLMEQQQWQSRLPDLHVMAHPLEIRTIGEVYGELNKEIARYAGKESRNDISFMTPDIDIFHPVIDIINVGFHAAKKIKVWFEYDMEQVKKAFSRSLMDYVSIDFSNDHEVSIKVSDNAYKKGYNLLAEKMVQHFNYLLPIDKLHHIYPVLPSSYLELLMFYYNLEPGPKYLHGFVTSYNFKTVSDEHGFPNLKMKLEYLDVLNTLHTAEYNIYLIVRKDFKDFLTPNRFQFTINHITPFIWNDDDFRNHPKPHKIAVKFLHFC